MITLILFILLTFRLFYLFFIRYKNTLVYPEYFIIAPPIILFCIPFIFGGFKSLSDLTNYGLLVIFLLSFFNSKSVYRIFDVKSKKFKVSKKTFYRIISFFSNFYLLITLYTIFNILKSGSLLEILIGNRLEVYFDEGISKASALGTLSTIFSFFYYLKISMLYKEKKFVTFSLFIFIEIFFLMLTAVTRLSVAFPILSLFIFWGYNLKIGRKKILIYSSVIFSVLVFYMSFTNRLRTGQEVTEIGSFDKTLGHLSKELDYENYHNLIVNYTNIYDFEYGYGWYLGGIVNFMPRFIYKDKPTTSSANRLTEKISGEPPSMYNPVMTFTLIGDGYYQLSYIGVVFNLVFFYFVSSIIFWKLYYLPKEIGIYALIRFSFMAFIYFRAEIPFIQFFVYLFLIYFINFFRYEGE